MRTAGTAILFISLWLLLSGIYKPLVIGFGVASVAVVMFVILRMNAVDRDRIDIRLKPIGSIMYFLWLLGEIAKANWTVTKIIVSPRMPLRQHFFAVPYTQKTDLAQVIYANSITLTPGTLTIETEPDTFLVHAVAYVDEDMDALADMDRRVSMIEEVGAA